MINLEHIRKRYGDKEVLRDVTVTIEDGTIFGLIGKNGAGKTTLINIIAGILPYNGGTVCVKNKNGESARIGYLPDLPAFYDYMTAEEYIKFLANGDMVDITEILNKVSLDGKVRISSMSRGMRQRLGVAAMLVGNPDVILLDEPTSALDPSGRADVMEILRMLRDDGKTIILSTHILADMEKVCDKVGFLVDGVITKDMSVATCDSEIAELYVRFADAIKADVFAKRLSVSQIDDNTLCINVPDGELIETERILFTCLANVKNPVVSISTRVSDLDDMFKEVYR